MITSRKSASKRSPNRRRVDQAALAPQRIDAALQPKRSADVAREARAGVPDLLDDLIGPVLLEAERPAVAGHDTQQALDRGIGALLHLVGVGRGDAALFRFDHGEDRP